MSSSGKPHLEVVRGGRATDAGDDDWRAFCGRIGWQQPSEPELARDYEDLLALRIFGPSENLVSLAAERERRRGATLVVARDDREQAVGVWWALGVAAALVLLVAGALLAWQQAAPSARTIPTPVPEMTQRATVAPAPAPTESVDRAPVEPAPVVQAPNPGARSPRRTAAAPRALAAVAQPVPVTNESLAISPDADAGEPVALAALERGRSIPLAPVDERLELPAEAPEHTPGRALPSWLDLAMTAPREHDGVPAGFRVMAQLDLADAGRQLVGQL